MQAVLGAWATACVATFHLQVWLMAERSKWMFQWNFCVLILLFWLGSWYSLNAGQSVNPHICIVRLVNCETVKCCWLLLLQDFTCVLKNCSGIEMLCSR